MPPSDPSGPTDLIDSGDAAAILNARLTQTQRIRDLYRALVELSGRVHEGIVALKARFLSEPARAERNKSMHYVQEVTSVLDRHRETMNRIPKRSETISASAEFATRKISDVLADPERAFADPTIEDVDRRLAHAIATLETSCSLLEGQLKELAEVEADLDRIVIGSGLR